MENKIEVVLIVDGVPSAPVVLRHTKASREDGTLNRWYGNAHHPAGFGGGINIKPGVSASTVTVLQQKVAELEKLLASKK